LFLFVDFSNLANFVDQYNSLKQQSSSKLIKSIDNNILEDNIIFRIFNIDYFYLDLEKFYNKSNIVTIEKKTIYREIYIFCCRINNYVTIVKKEKIKNYISICFRNNVLYQHRHFGEATPVTQWLH
jgi:hypothetical protein